MKFSIEHKIFDKWPEVKVGILVLTGIDNSKTSEEVLKLLRFQEEVEKERLADIGIPTLPEVQAWQKAYQEFGSNPKEFRSSVEALLRRAQNGKPLPQISTLVDLGNYLSLKYHLTTGVEDLNKVVGDISLTFAKGDERGIYIGAEEEETAYPGEVIYKDNVGFLCRRWNWREGKRTAVDKETTNAVLVLEAVPPTELATLEQALGEASQLIKKFLGGKVKKFVIDIDSPEVEVSFETKTIAKNVNRPSFARPGLANVDNKPISRWHLKKGDGTVLVGVAMELQEMVWRVAKELTPDLKLEEVKIEHPAQESFGDYSTNVAMTMFPKSQNFNSKFKSPPDLASEIAQKLAQDKKFKDMFQKVEVAGGGFLNLWLQTSYLGNQLGRVTKEGNSFGKSDLMVNKKILLEHTSPNPQTTIMLGHLRNNFLGMTMARLWEAQGARVKRDCIVNDRGIHLCRSMFGYLVFADKTSGIALEDIKDFRKLNDTKVLELSGKRTWQEMIQSWKTERSGWLVPADLGLKPDHANLIWYVLGSRAYGLSEGVKQQAGEMLVAWEKRDKKLWELWKTILDWSSEGYAQTYRRIGSVHDWTWHESDHFERGKEIVEEGLKKGVFVRSEGAVVTDLAKYGLPNTVVVKADGTALYITQDLALTKLKRERFPSDLYVWDIGEEQTLYFKQLFAICEQLEIGKLSDYLHLGYALVNFKGGKKMATRKGDVVVADGILDGLRDKAMKLIKSTKQELRGDLSEDELRQLAETIGVGAIKYSLLLFGRNTTIQFDADESLSLEGNSGPYLQYTYARTQSVLRKSEILNPKLETFEFRASSFEFNPEELALLRWLYRFPEVVAEAAQLYAPNFICNYLFDLAQRFNLFYQKHRILENQKSKIKNQKFTETETFRLLLTAAVGQILKNGLGLLGIASPERM